MNYKKIESMNTMTPFYFTYNSSNDFRVNETKPNHQCNLVLNNIDYSRNPDNWGPHLWFYLHNCSANYPMNPDQETKEAMISYLLSLGYTIPCKECSIHYKRMIDSYKYKLPEICSSRERLFNFIVDLHNQVNVRTNKPIMNIENARKMYYYKNEF